MKSLRKIILPVILCVCLVLLPACAATTDETPTSGDVESNDTVNGADADAGTNDSADAGEDTEQLVIGWSQTDNQNNWKITQTNSVSEEVEARGWKLIYTDAQGDTSKQISDIEDLVAQGIDYLIVSPREAEGLESAFQLCMSNDIPVICIDRGVNGEVGVDYTCKITTDLEWEGAQCAEYLLSDYGEEACNVVELTGTPGATSAIDRQNGFMAAIEGHDNIEIVASQNGNFNRSTSQEAMESIIQSLGAENIDAVFAHNDDNALGAIQAMKAAGIEPGVDIKVYSCDGQKDALEAIVAGELVMTVECSPRYGPIGCDTIEKLEAGETVDEWVILSGKVYDISNAEELMDEAF